MQEQERLRIMAIGDVIGRTGRQLLKRRLHQLREQLEVDVVVANAENCAGGFGVTQDAYKELIKAGVDYMTSGNHVYDKKGTENWLDQADRLVRPINFPPGSHGHPFILDTMTSGHRIAIVNPIGRVFMKTYDCPFRAMENWLNEFRNQADLVLVDMHAEATSEKMAMGQYLAGQVSAVWGTHTHVPTADARLLGTTGYVTDLGMTGAYDSVIGMEKESVIAGFFDLKRRPFEVAKNDPRISFCIFDVTPVNGRCIHIQSHVYSMDQLEEIYGQAPN
ncbi:MAG: YmdB family metallophosphoesterase [Acidobacteria bacterium]|nr:YmdB family metallophosphoesterase [Acidobacteriota bacterium]